MFEILVTMIQESTLLSIPYYTHHYAFHYSTYPINYQFNDDYKSFHHHLHYGFLSHLDDFISIFHSYIHFLCYKKNSFISSQCHSLCDTLSCNSKLFWYALFPHCSSLPSSLHLHSLTTHVSTLYVIPCKPPLLFHISPSCHLFTPSIICVSIKFMSSSRATNKEGFLGKAHQATQAQCPYLGYLSSYAL